MTAQPPADAPKQEIHDQIGKLKTDLFKCIGTIEGIQSKCRQHDTRAQPPAAPEQMYLITAEELERACAQLSGCGYGVSANYIDAMVKSRPHDTRTQPADAPAPINNAPCLERQAEMQELLDDEKNRTLDKIIEFVRSGDCAQADIPDMDCHSTTEGECVICFCNSIRSGNSPQQRQPATDAPEHFRATVELKHQEMIDLMRRNGLKIENLEDPMQKLALTLFSQIGELSYQARVIREEREEAAREQHSEPCNGEEREERSSSKHGGTRK